MSVLLLDAEETARLRAAELTYAEVGATAAGAPAGYRTISRCRELRGRSFDGAVEDLMRWRMHERAGLRVAASSERVTVGDVVVLLLGRTWVGIRIPCRVVYTILEQHRVGFAYGTLPGHPEAGEERFVVERGPDGAVRFSITAFCRPARPLARLGGPVTRRLQDLVTNRYLQALDRG